MFNMCHILIKRAFLISSLILKIIAMKLTTKLTYFASALLVGGLVLNLSGCKHDDDDPKPADTNLNTQVRVQVAYDATDVVFKYTWKSQKKLYPSGKANTGQNYPGHFHDILKHNGTKFDRLPSGERLEEDRITFMIDRADGNIAGFGKAGCAVTCHTGMESHNTDGGTVDHWHWRGGRSGPMGYAEDAAVNDVERIRDNTGTPPSKFTRAGGDRLREDQAALTGTAHNVQSNGLPRFVFNKGKVMPGSYTIPSYFLASESGQILSDPYTQLPQIRDLSKNRSLLVVYQDFNFDGTDKVNAIDLSYLIWLAYDVTTHLPAHLQDETTADFMKWKDFWASQLNIATAAAALTKLDDIYNEWNANKQAMVTRSVGFIYNSDQHDVMSERSYNTTRNEWTVILKRKLNTGSNRDADLSGLASGTVYTISFAMHDSGSGSETHDISMPLSLSNATDAELRAVQVSNAGNVDWSKVPMYDTYWVKQSVMPQFYLDWLQSSAHPGAGVLNTMDCKSCHTGEKSLLTNMVIQ